MAKKPLNLKKEHKSKKGGLTEKGRKYINAKTGSNLKAPVTSKEASKSKTSAKRRKSFCARMEGVKGPLEKNGKPTRKKLALKRWDCK
jgi:hypothetical protein